MSHDTANSEPDAAPGAVANPELSGIPQEPSSYAGVAFGAIAVAAVIIGAVVWARSDSPKPVAKKPVKGGGKTYDRPEIAAAGPYPKVEVNGSHQFGIMEVGSSRSHTFIVKNIGEADLVLKRGPKSCNCSAYDVKNSVVAPGEQTEVLFEWTPKKPEAPFQQFVNLYTNDPEQPTVTLGVLGRVAELITIMPQGEWDLGNVDKRGERRGLIYTRMLDQLEIIDIKSDPALTVGLSPAEDAVIDEFRAKYAQRMNVTIDKSKIPAGAFRGSVSFKVAGRPDRSFEIITKAYKDGSVRFEAGPGVRLNKERASISLGVFPSPKGRQAKVLLYLSGDHQTMTPEKIRTRPDFLKCTLEKDDTYQAANMSRYCLNLEVPPNSRPDGYSGSNHGEIIITTDHPEYPEIKYRVNFVVTKPR